NLTSSGIRCSEPAAITEVRGFPSGPLVLLIWHFGTYWACSARNLSI
ncbi:uncharacterized protein METZ01_LOCUS259731, partial [marine metagenome]